jgi:asparagine synthetase B (glutamine-hydrolysing)
LSLGFNQPQQVEPNTTIKLSLDNFTEIKKSTVYDFDLTQYKTTFDDLINKFEKAILKRVTNVKHDIFIGLSSGYDSGAIACVLNKYNIKYTAYSIKGSENDNIINQRKQSINNFVNVELTPEQFINQKRYLQSNCEEYKFFIDNDERTNLKIWQEKLLLEPDNVLFKNKVNSYQNALNKAQNKKITEDNGAIGLGHICSIARPKNELIYLTGSGADEIISDYGWKGVRHYRHSTIGGLFPDDLKTVFPWRNFFHNTQRAYLMKEEYIAGTYGIEGRYPFLDKHLVQEFLWLSPELKNKWYKAPLHHYLTINNYPFDINQKMGFNCGFTSAQNDSVTEQIAVRTTIGETNDVSLIVKN